ncbi:MAG: DUF1295 domain-containing protein [Bacteroidales bacterium]
MENTRIKVKGLLVTLIAYLTALIFVFLFYPLVRSLHPILAAAILDALATVVVFIFSMAFNNSSVYDPYWSVAPIPILLFWKFSQPAAENPVAWIILALVLLWGTRLTYNWARRWTGLQDEDWRYTNFRKQFPGIYWLISFLGIHLFPTILVFLGCMAVYPAITANINNISFLDIIAMLVTLSAILLEYFSDEQLRSFVTQKSGSGAYLKTGLWKYSRHPNYFGEVLFWIGLSIFSMKPMLFEWWILSGPLAMILLFFFISVPMTDERMLGRKKGYDAHMKHTSGLIPWPPKHTEHER